MPAGCQRVCVSGWVSGCETESEARPHRFLVGRGSVPHNIAKRDGALKLRNLRAVGALQEGLAAVALVGDVVGPLAVQKEVDDCADTSTRTRASETGIDRISAEPRVLRFCRDPPRAFG